MLKIYWRTDKYELSDGKRIIRLKTVSNRVIRDEADAISSTVEFGAYTEAAEIAYFPDCELIQKRKGIKANYWHHDSCVVAKEWLVPDVKLIKHRSYRETYCSMKELMSLETTDVIAYLKQEGLNLTTPS